MPACLAAAAASADAVPIAFTDVRFAVTAIATADGPAGFDSIASPPATAPVAAMADSIGATDVATAGAIAGPAFLSTSADVTAVTGIAHAVGAAQFSGTFVGDWQLWLNVDFTSLGFGTGSSQADSTLFMTLSSGGTTLFRDFVGRSRQFEFALVPGTTGLLTLELVSQATAGFPSMESGGASALGVVAFEGVTAVPEPATWLLLAFGTGMIAAVARRGRSTERS